jgi:DNA polymerase III subunit delta'
MIYELKGPESQAPARALLMEALKDGRFPQSVIIEGPCGIGKKKLAMELAQALCCTDAEKRPCGHCFGCKVSLDPGNTAAWVIPLETKEANAKSAADASAGSTGKTVEDYLRSYIEEIIRNPYAVDYLSSIAQISVEQIRTSMSQFSLKGDRVRCVIIAEADRMNEAAANALLKTLEEVPPDTYFILTAGAPERLLQTIRSRCLTFRLPPLTDGETRKIAEELFGRELPPDAIGMAMGSPGMALYYAEDDASRNTLAFDFLRDSIGEKYSDLFFELDNENIKDPDEVCLVLRRVGFFIADALRIRAGEAPRITDMAEPLRNLHLERFGETALQEAILAVDKFTERVVNRKNSPAVALETLAIELFEGYKEGRH